MSFKNIIGQKDVINYLTNAFSEDKIGHAYIFCGPEGIGKKTVAEEFAALILCENPRNNKKCGQCSSCRLFESGASPDIRRLSVESLSIGVDEVRESLSDLVIKPMYSARKVYIINDAEKLTAQAQNAILKSLEEPPSYATIILITTVYDILLETIRSRAVKVKFKENSYQEVMEAITKKLGPGIDKERAEFAALWSNGSIGRALAMAEGQEFSDLREKTFDAIIKIEKEKLRGIFEISSFFEKNKESCNLILDFMISYYRDILMAAETANENMLINKDKEDIIFTKVFEYTAEQLAAAIAYVIDAKKNIRYNANYMLAIENMLIGIAQI
jgi:DNA polymerase-3 subunit delta'